MCFVSDYIANCGPTYSNIVMTYVLLNATFLVNPDFVHNLSHSGRHWKVSTDLALTGGGGGVPCRLSVLRNGNVACVCRLFMPMSHVEFEKRQCHMSL